MADTVKMLKALADDNRLKIFTMLTEGETCACRILEQLNIAQPTLSRHMKILVDSGLVSVRKDAQWMRYSINRDNLNELNQFFRSLSEEIPVIGTGCGCK